MRICARGSDDGAGVTKNVPSASGLMRPRIKRGLPQLRLVLAVMIAVGLAGGGVFGFQAVGSSLAKPTVHWQAGYLDVTATSSFKFGTAGSPVPESAVLSFVVSDPDSACVPNWGGLYSLEGAAQQLDLDHRIARLKKQGGSIAVSFGGPLNDELAVRCMDATKLFEAYASVVNRYETGTIDLDIEGVALTDSRTGLRRATAIAALQKARGAAGRDLKVWLTLPAAPTGLTQAGTEAIVQLLDSGVDLAGVNVLTMDYGAAKPADQSMGDASIQTLMAVHAQFATLLKAARLDVSDPEVWQRIGATPMIGVNDERGEVFSLDDAATLNRFAQDRGVARMSLFSTNRDRTCSSSPGVPEVVSQSCSGVEQGDVTFASVLGIGFDQIMPSSTPAPILSGSVFSSPPPW